jgi:hypothetical protein
MKLNGKMMVAVVMVLGALGAAGCNRANDAGDAAVAPEENPATAPVDSASTSTTPGVAQDFFGFRGSFGPRYYAPHAPPAARYEVFGRAPSARHFWAPGYYRWNGREFGWVGGRWELRRDGFEFIAPHWVNRFGRYEYIPGHWVRR